MQAALDTTEASILGRVIQPEAGGWPPAAAEAILSMSFGTEDRERMVQLLESAKAGTLAGEDAEALWDPLESTCRHASLSIL